MTDVVIEVSRGTVTQVYAGSADIRAIIVDWDLITNGGGATEAGYSQECLPLAELRGSVAAEAERVRQRRA